MGMFTRMTQEHMACAVSSAGLLGAYYFREVLGRSLTLIVLLFLGSLMTAGVHYLELRHEQREHRELQQPEPKPKQAR